MIHRAMLGSLERFLGILIEHTAGAFPLWLAPVQATVLPVSEKFARLRARGARRAARGAGCGSSSTTRNEKLGYKIRQAQLAEGARTCWSSARRRPAAGRVAVRLRTGEDLGAIPVAELVSRLVAQSARREAALPGAS